MRTRTSEVLVGAFHGRLQSRELGRPEVIRLYFGQTKVEHLRMTPFGDKNIGWLDIAVHDSGGMRCARYILNIWQDDLA